MMAGIGLLACRALLIVCVDSPGLARDHHRRKRRVLPAGQLRYVLRRPPAYDVPARQRSERLRAGPAVVHPPRLGLPIVP